VLFQVRVETGESPSRVPADEEAEDVDLSEELTDDSSDTDTD